MKQHFYLHWICDYCNSLIKKGTHTHCTQCGSPRPENVKWLFPEESEREDVIDPQQLANINIPDKNCSHCTSAIKSWEEFCGSCGNPVDENDNVQKQQTYISGTEPIYIPPTTETDYTTSSYHSEDNNNYFQDNPDTIDDNISRAITNTYYNTTQKKETTSKKGILLGILGILSLTLLIWGGIQLFSSYETTGTILGFENKTEVILENFAPRQKSGWSHPSDAYNISSKQKKIGSHENCVTKYKKENYKDCITTTTNNGNGTATSSKKCTTKSHKVPYKDCKTVIEYDTWYNYTVDRWAYYKTIPKTNYSQKIIYAEYNISNTIRLLEKKDYCYINIRVEGKKYKEKVSKVYFRSANKHQKVKVDKRKHFNSIKIIE